MDGHTFISWNIANFITVVLMAVVGVIVLRAATSFWQSRRGATP